MVIVPGRALVGSGTSSLVVSGYSRASRSCSGGGGGRLRLTLEQSEEAPFVGAGGSRPQENSGNREQQQAKQRHVRLPNVSLLWRRFGIECAGLAVGSIISAGVGVYCVGGGCGAFGGNEKSSARPGRAGWTPPSTKTCSATARSTETGVAWRGFGLSRRARSWPPPGGPVSNCVGPIAGRCGGRLGAAAGAGAPGD